MMAHRRIIKFLITNFIFICGKAEQSPPAYVKENNPGCLNTSIKSWTLGDQSSVSLSFYNLSFVVCTVNLVPGDVPKIFISLSYENRVSCGIDTKEKETSICFTKSVNISDAGVYFAQLLGSQTLVQSTQTLFVMRPPTKPIINLGGNFVFDHDQSMTCIANSTSRPVTGLPLIYSWYINQTDITDSRFISSGPNNDVLTIQNIKKEDKWKRIQCKATEEKGFPSDFSNRTILDIKYVPEVSITPKNHTVRQGDTVVLKCQVDDANPTVIKSFKWEKKGEGYLSSTNQTLIIYPAKISDIGVYKCVADNSLGPSQPATANVDVEYPPVVLPLLKQNIVEGRNLSVNCNLSFGNPAFTRVLWIKVNETSVRYEGITLQLPNIKRRSSGIYKCTAENTFSNGKKGTSNQTMEVNVLYPPSVSPLPKIKDVIEGENLTVRCPFTPGNPSFTNVFWSKEGDPGFEKHYEILQLYSIKRNSSGTYSCTAENSYNTVEKGTDVEIMEVNVQYQPNIEEKPSVTVNEGQSVTLSRKISSNPLSSAFWYSGNQLLNHQMSVKTAELIINETSCTDTKNYTLVASNKIKNVTAMVELLVNCKPNPGISNISVGITDTSGIKFSTEVIAYPKPQYELKYENGTKNNMMTDTVSQNAVNNITIHFNQSIVQKSDYGIYNLDVWNFFGKTTILINVIPQRKPDSPLDIKVSCDVTSARIQWSSAFDGGANQSFIAFAFASAQNVGHSTTVLDKGERKNHETNVFNLQSSTFYTFYVFSRNIHGNTSSTESSCTTLAEVKDPSSEAVIAISAVAAVASIAVIVIVFIYVRRHSKHGKKKSVHQSETILTEDRESDEDDGLKENKLYVSAGPRDDEKPGISGTAVYAEVNKRGPTSDSNANVYAEVQKSGKKAKDKVELYSDATKQKKGFFKKEEKTKQKKAKKMKQNKEVTDVYENPEEIVMTQNLDNVYSNTAESNGTKRDKNGYKNQDGLLYVEVQFDQRQDSGKPVIHGEEEKTDYATVEFPFPPSSNNDKPTDKK